MKSSSLLSSLSILGGSVMLTIYTMNKIKKMKSIVEDLIGLSFSSSSYSNLLFYQLIPWKVSILTYLKNQILYRNNKGMFHLLCRSKDYAYYRSYFSSVTFSSSPIYILFDRVLNSQPIIRFIVTNGELATKILRIPPDSGNWIKPNNNNGIASRLISSSCTAVEGKQHYKQHRILVNCISNGAKFTKYVTKAENELKEKILLKISDKVSTNCYLREDIFIVSLNLMISILFGEKIINSHFNEFSQFSSLYSSFWYRLRETNEEINRPDMLINYSHQLRFILNQLFDLAAAGVEEEEANLFKSMMEYYVQKDDDDKNKQEDKPLYLTREEIIHNIYSILTGGFETIAHCINVSIAYLSIRPDLQKYCREEENPNNSLMMMNSIIKEVLRLAPPNPQMNRICNNKQENRCLDETYLPKVSFGAHFIVDIFGIHHNQNIFGEDVNEFKPERWLEDTEKCQANFFAFGKGPRVCVGQSLALNAIERILMTFNNSFSYSAVDANFTPKFELSSATLLLVNDPLLLITKI